MLYIVISVITILKTNCNNDMFFSVESNCRAIEHFEGIIVVELKYDG